MPLDLAELAQGVIENNMGVGGIELQVRGRVRDGQVTLAETGQTLPVSGAPPSSTQPWLAFEVQGWSAGPVTLAFVAERDAPILDL